MRKPSKTVPREELTAAETRIDLLARALQYAVADSPDATVTATEDGWTYRWSLYHATAAHGGIVITRASTRDQRPNVSAEYLDSWRHNLDGSVALAYRAKENAACYEFMRVRDRLDAARRATA